MLTSYLPGAVEVELQQHLRLPRLAADGGLAANHGRPLRSPCSASISLSVCSGFPTLIRMQFRSIGESK